MFAGSMRRNGFCPSIMNSALRRRNLLQKRIFSPSISHLLQADTESCKGVASAAPFLPQRIHNYFIDYSKEKWYYIR